LPYQKHYQLFKEIPSNDSKIWRFMDFPELMALLEYHTLFFPKSTKLGSKYEGEYSYAEEEWNKIIYKDKIPNDTICKVLKDNKSYNKLQMECVFINCWHINDYESNLLWNYYSGDNGIAIQSTFGNVIMSFDKSLEIIYGGPVYYIDYFEDWMPNGNILFPFIRKPIFFKEEHELRFLTYHHPKPEQYREYLKIDGKHIKVNIDMLIETIYLSPSSPHWMFDLLKSIVKRYNLNKEVIVSKLHFQYEVKNESEIDFCHD
jgi:hypothetical protein